MFGHFVPESQRDRDTKHDDLICDCCGDVTLDLMDVPGMWEILVQTRKPTPAEIRAAPRRPTRWCASCMKDLAKWKAHHQIEWQAPPKKKKGKHV